MMTDIIERLSRKVDPGTELASDARREIKMLRSRLGAVRALAEHGLRSANDTGAVAWRDALQEIVVATKHF